ncbi:MAG: UDP-3-O-acyl-N-acetylglucosamine deacetylase [Hyphomicrobiales bacterium]|nr:UDP-3-O-acyl-N-acetylglucosamine deacetylase [Hyphomicrobiales bacterium]
MRKWQGTLDSRITAAGIGLHGGERVSIALTPAAAGSGITFAREGGDGIPASYEHVTSTPLSTRLSNGGAEIATVEHVLAACFVCGIDNACIEVDAGEIPIMDGSALPFADLILETGVRTMEAPLQHIRVLKSVAVEEEGKRVELAPFDGFAVDVEIDFKDKVIGRQSFRANMSEVNFLHEVLPARTFAFERDVEAMRARGLALGGSLDNAIVIGENEVLNPEGLRFKNEFVRHKCLDAIGDMALAGKPLLAHYRAYAPSHALNNQLLRKLFSRPDAWKLESGGDLG